jgi:hypothetical protein
MRPTALLFAVVLLGCKVRRAETSSCALSGPPGFSAYPAACTSEDCRACAAQLGTLWSRRTDPAARAAFRVSFMRASADARDVFARAARLDGTWAFEHCTAGLAPGSACATYSPFCVDTITNALRSGDTPMPWRVQLDVAVGKSCDRSRDELVARLRGCAPFEDRTTCESAGCNACLAGHLAALTVLAPVIDRADRLEQFVSLVDESPEVIARATVEALGAPDPPADIEPTVAQRALRHHCISLTRRSAAAPPMACDAMMSRLLGDNAFADFDRAWSALGAARPDVRAALLDALLRDLGRLRALAPAVATKLRALPATELASALRRALARPITAEMYTALRAELLRVNPTGEALPPETQPVAAPAPPVAPALPGGGTLPPARPVAQG